MKNPVRGCDLGLSIFPDWIQTLAASATVRGSEWKLGFDLVGVAGLAEGDHAGYADFLHGGTSWL